MAQALNILQVCNRIPFPLNDGGNIATYYVTRFLHESGQKVTLAALNTRKHHQDPAVLSSIAEVHTVDIDTSLSIAGLLKGFFQQAPYNVERFRSAEFEQLLIELVKKNKPDVIQLEGSYMCIYAPVLREHSNAFLVLRSHNVEYQIWQRMAQSETNLLKRLYLNNLSPKIRRFEDESMHLVDAIAAITPQDVAYYKAHGFKGPILHLPAGALLSEKNTLETKEFDLGFLGSMEWMPNLQGVEWFVEKCWKKLRNKRPDLRFHIAGKHTPQEWWVRQQEGVVVHGEVPDAGVFMRKCTLFVVPLLSGGGMRVKIIEAMAQRSAIVSTSVGAEGIDVEHGKEIYIADNAEDFIAAIEQLLNNPSVAEKIAVEAASKAMSKYNWKNIVNSLEEFYFSRMKKDRS